MTKNCPCCGHALSGKEPLIISEEHRLVSYRGRPARFPARVVRLAKMLRTRPQTADQLAGEYNPRVFYVYINQLKKRLAKLDFGLVVERDDQGRYRIIAV